jgi:hypothetical protein
MLEKSNKKSPMLLKVMKGKFFIHRKAQINGKMFRLCDRIMREVLFFKHHCRRCY